MDTSRAGHTGVIAARRQRPGASVLVLAGAAAAVLAACGGGSTASPPPPASAATAAPSGSTAGVTVSVAQTGLGSVLAGPNGHTLYTLLSSSGAPVACSGACLQAWPPLTLATGSPQAGSGVSATLATTQTAAGRQVAVGGDPLYYFSGDTSSGQTSGQRLQSFGGTWYALQANGQTLTSAGGGSNSSSSGSPGGGY